MGPRPSLERRNEKFVQWKEPPPVRREEQSFHVEASSSRGRPSKAKLTTTHAGGDVTGSSAKTNPEVPPAAASAVDSGGRRAQDSLVTEDVPSGPIAPKFRPPRQHPNTRSTGRGTGVSNEGNEQGELRSITDDQVLRVTHSKQAVRENYKSKSGNVDSAANRPAEAPSRGNDRKFSLKSLWQYISNVESHKI